MARSGNNFSYPNVRRDETVIDDYHGTLVPDPYRWLENPNSEEVGDFVEQQNKITVPYLESCTFRDYIRSRVTELCNYAKYSCPFQMGSRYFYFKNSGLQNQMTLYVQDSMEGESRVFFDPNRLSHDGRLSLHSYSFSESGEIFAYGVSSCGSDWFTIHFKDVGSGQDYEDVLENVKFSSISWTHDNMGIFYSCYPRQIGKRDGTETTVNENQKLYYHLLGSSQDQDILITEFPDNPKWRISSTVSDCGNYLIITPWESCRNNLLWYSVISESLNSGMGINENTKLTFTPIISVFEADYKYITNVDTRFYVLTNKGALNYKLVAIDVNNFGENSWTTIVEEHPKDVLEWASRVGNDKLCMCYIRDVAHVIKIARLEDGHLLKTIDLELGAVTGHSGRRFDTDVYFKLENFLSPGKIYRIDLTQSEFNPQLFRELKQTNFDASKFTMKQIFYSSKDGTKVPMFLVYKKDIEMTGDNFCRLYGYGGFNVSQMATFSAPRITFVDMFEGVFALPNIRGGGEYGNSWYMNGTRLNKQNGFDDFIAAAEYLINNGYTNPSKLVIQGGSNGGLLVGACMNQRPELFGAVIAQVGVLDMLRFHKFTVGFGWVSDYGCADEEEHFENLFKLSPLHNVKVPKDDKVQYPAALLLTADHDDRVVPLHSFKFISELQYKLGTHPNQTNPLMIRVDRNVGHGSGKSLSKIIGEYTDIISFIFQSLEVDFKIH